MTEEVTEVTHEIAEMYQLSGPWIGQTIYVAAQLGLVDIIGDGTIPIGRLAERTATHEDSLYRFARVLDRLGILREHPGRAFSVSSGGLLLSANSASSFRDSVLLQGGACFRAWSEVLHSVRTGQPAFDRAHGVSYFDFLKNDREESAVFNRAMGATMHAAVAALAPQDFTGVRQVVDVGGGNGRLMASVLARSPGTTGIVQDLPGAIAAAPDIVAEAGVGDRCQLVAGDFFESVPGGADVYLLSRVLHDWNDENALRILRRVREAMRSDSRLLIVDTVLRPTEGLDFGVLADLLMLVVVGGKERTEEDWRNLLDAAAFRLSSISGDVADAATRGHSVIEAVPTRMPS